MKTRAFSLVEIVLALGIISFAIVGIMGLLPVAMRSAQESQRESRATLIAGQILSDLRSLTGTNAFISTTPDVLTGAQTVDLRSDGTFSVGYNENGVPVGSGERELFRAEVSVRANSPTNGLALVQVDVQPTPASPTIPAYRFTTILNQN